MASNFAIHIDNDEIQVLQTSKCSAEKLANGESHAADINLFQTNPDLPEGPDNKVL